MRAFVRINFPYVIAARRSSCVNSKDSKDDHDVASCIAERVCNLPLDSAFCVWCK